MNQIFTSTKKFYLGFLFLMLAGFYVNAQTPVNQWDFESLAVTADQMGNSELVNYGSIAANDYNEPDPPGYGTSGAVFNGVDKYFEIPWASTAPWQAGQSTAGTFMAAFKMPDAIPEPAMYFLAHYSTSANRSIAVVMPGSGSGTPGQIALNIGYNEGGSYSGNTLGTPCIPGNRYIFAVAFDSNTKEILIRVYSVDEAIWLNDLSKTADVDPWMESTTIWTIGKRSTDETGYFDGTIYWARVYNEFLSVDNITAIIEGATATKDIKVSGSELNQNYPNPFSVETAISYTIEKAEHVSIDIYNNIGQKVRTLVNEKKQANSYTVKWDTRGDMGQVMPEGMYFYTIKTDNSNAVTRKMLLMK